MAPHHLGQGAPTSITSWAYWLTGRAQDLDCRRCMCLEVGSARKPGSCCWKCLPRGGRPGGAGREPGRGGDGGRSQLCSRGWPLLLETRWDRTRGGVNPGGGGRGSGVRSWRSGGGHPSCALGGRHWGWTRAGSAPGAGSTRAARVETPIAVGGGRSQLCSGDPHCGWEGTGSMAGAGRRGAGVGSWRGWGRASPLSSRGSPWRLGTPIACAPGSPRIGIQWARRRGADHRSGNWDCVEQGTT